MSYFIMIAGLVVLVSCLVFNGILIAKGAHHLVRGLNGKKDRSEDAGGRYVPQASRRLGRSTRAAGGRYVPQASRQFGHNYRPQADDLLTRVDQYLGQ